MNQEKKPPYWKLLPPDPTPEDELCSCAGKPPLKLMSALAFNPLHCLDCNLEKRLEGLGLDESLSEHLAWWNNLYKAIDYLELDSGEYESWAQSQLKDIHSHINQKGLELNQEINKIWKCYFWYWQDQVEEDWQPIRTCPVCQGPLSSYTMAGHKNVLCETCHLGTWSN